MIRIKNIDFILKYKNMMKVSKMCKIVGVDYTNLIKGRTTAENIEKINVMCKKEINNLNKDLIEVLIDEKTDTL